MTDARGAADEIVAIHSVEIIEGDRLVLRVFLADGGIACCHWPLAALQGFVARVGGPQYAPTGIALQ